MKRIYEPKYKVSKDQDKRTKRKASRLKQKESVVVQVDNISISEGIST